MRGHLTEKVDVFSFGVVLLEIVSGRPNSDSSLEGEKVYLLEWVCILPLLIMNVIFPKKMLNVNIVLLFIIIIPILHFIG